MEKLINQLKDFSDGTKHVYGFEPECINALREAAAEFAKVAIRDLVEGPRTKAMKAAAALAEFCDEMMS